MARRSLPQIEDAFILDEYLTVTGFRHGELLEHDPAIAGKKYTTHDCLLTEPYGF